MKYACSQFGPDVAPPLAGVAVNRLDKKKQSARFETELEIVQFVLGIVQFVLGIVQFM